MIVLQIMIILSSAFLGYIIGRVGDYFLNPLLKDPAWAPHHWIYGVIIMIIGLIIMENHQAGLWLFSFGIGHFVSDLKDFIDLKFIGSDKKDKVKFWGID